MTISNQINNVQITTCNIVRYTSGSGTYTPSAGTKFIIVEMCGGGGGSGGISIASTSTIRCSAPGGGGNYLKFKMTAAQIGSSLSYAVGAGGTFGSSTPTDGGNGGNTTFGNWTASGGNGSVANTASNSASNSNSTANTTGTGQLIQSMDGGTWNCTFSSAVTNLLTWSMNPGGTNPLSSPGVPYVGVVNVTGSGNSSLIAGGAGGRGYGMGAPPAGRYVQATGTQPVTGGGSNGTAGVIIITEFI